MTVLSGEKLSIADHPLAQSIRSAGNIALTYPMYDAEWRINDSNFADYCADADFAGRNLSQIIYESAQPGDVGLDIAGGTNAIALQDLLKRGTIQRAAVTNLEDRRTEEVRQDPRLSHIAGNMLELNTWDTVLRWQQDNAPNGLGVVLHRPIGGLQDLSQEFYYDSADLIISMLRPGGIFFSQVPQPLSRVQRVDLCHNLRSRHAITVNPSDSMPGQLLKHVLITKQK